MYPTSALGDCEILSRAHRTSYCHQTSDGVAEWMSCWTNQVKSVVQYLLPEFRTFVFLFSGIYVKNGIHTLAPCRQRFNPDMIHSDPQAPLFPLLGTGDNEYAYFK